MRQFIKRLIVAVLLAIDAVLTVLSMGLLWAYAAYSKAFGVGSASRPMEACRLVILQPNVVAALRQHGVETILENHFSPYPEGITILDPSGSEETEAFVAKNVQIVSWRSSCAERWLRSVGLQSASEILGVILTSDRLIRFLSRRDDNVLRSVMHDRTALYGLMASRALRIPHIIEVAGNYELLQRLLGFTYYFGNFYRLRWLRPPVRSMSNWLLGLPLRRAFRVIGRNKNNYEHAFALGADVDRLSLVRIRISGKFFDRLLNMNSPKRPAEFRYMLYVARLAPEKRPLDCFDIFEKAAAEVNDVHLVVIGDGPLMPLVRQRQKESAYAERIHVLGALPNTDVVEWTRCAAIGLELYSGSSLVEKMTCGIPIVAYDVEWMSEVVIDGYTGQTADFPDCAGMAAHCINILRNPAAASQMGDRSRLLAQTLFDRKAIIQKEDSYLRRAVAGGAEIQ